MTGPMPWITWLLCCIHYDDSESEAEPLLYESEGESEIVPSKAPVDEELQELMNKACKYNHFN